MLLIIGINSLGSFLGGGLDFINPFESFFSFQDLFGGAAPSAVDPITTQIGAFGRPGNVGPVAIGSEFADLVAGESLGGGGSGGIGGFLGNFGSALINPTSLAGAFAGLGPLATGLLKDAGTLSFDEQVALKNIDNEARLQAAREAAGATVAAAEIAAGARAAAEQEANRRALLEARIRRAQFGRDLAAQTRQAATETALSGGQLGSQGFLTLAGLLGR